MLLRPWAPTSGPSVLAAALGTRAGAGALGRGVSPQFALRGAAQPLPHATAPFSVPPAVREDPHGPRPDPRDLVSFQLRPLPWLWLASAPTASGVERSLVRSLAVPVSLRKCRFRSSAVRSCTVRLSVVGL